MWQQELLKKFPQMEIAPVLPRTAEEAVKQLFGNSKIGIYLPKEPDAETKTAVQQIIPYDVDYVFVVGLKPSTIDQLKFLIAQAGMGLVLFNVNNTHVHLQLIAQDDPDESHPIWSDLASVLYKDGFPDTWEIIIRKTKRAWNRKVMDEVARHVAIEPITTSDILDLKIALNTTKDVNDFLALLERMED